ncbi:pre-toxin TG domain-containing protein [Streptococcus cristatus]|uniref:pre-toxin TG domain-containing protein n=1 Tax=Streptococcus cristatus TaxID=45634 RepID=UPI0028803D79|nr:T7SS effector LXG polymorphic toxin [Streptococcus cristatus]
MKIDMNEVQSNKTKLATSIKLMRGQVEVARSKLNQIVESQALQGDVKTAIDAKVKNHQMPMMTHYLTALEIMSADYEALISTFQSEVGESAQDAVIDTDYLAELGTIFPGISQGLATIRQSLSGTYSRISDLITLDASSTSDMSSNLSAAKQILTDTTDKMSAFNDLPRPETFSSIISQQNAQLGVLRSVQGPQYATEKAKALYTNQNFALSVTQYQLLSHQSNYRVMLQQKLARSLVDSYYSKRPVQASMQPYKLDAKTKDLIEKANKGDLQAISELSKSYRYDKTMERTVPYRSQAELARLNQEVWDRTLTTGQHILGEIFGIYDVYRLITGIDPVTGEETSRLEAGLWLALDILPFLKAGKAGKLGKIAKTADKVDDVAKGAKEAAEQAGKKVGKEFSKEASEQLAKHSDDVAKGLEETGKGLNKPEIPETEPRFGERKISQEEYKGLRSETPTDEIRDMVNDGLTLPMNDPVIPGNEITKRLEADHIVSMDRITRMDGFEKLTIEQQLEVLNYEDNFVGLSKSANASKGAKTYEDWTLYKKTGVPIDPAFRAEMMMKEKKLERLLQGMIDNFVKYNGG